MLFKVCSLDVLGNAEDGWQVNDVFGCGSIEVANPDDDDEVVKALVDNGYLKEGTNITLDDVCEKDIYIGLASNGRPLLNLIGQ